MTTAPTTPTARHARPVTKPGVGSRRIGYTAAIVVNAVLLYLLNREPGWQDMPFLTADTASVLWLVNASLLIGIAVNLVYIVQDPVWLRSVGEAVSTGVGLAALVAIWRVWPFDLSDTWNLVARWAVGVGIVGSLIAIVVALARLTRWFAASPSSDE